MVLGKLRNRINNHPPGGGTAGERRKHDKERERRVHRIYVQLQK